MEILKRNSSFQEFPTSPYRPGDLRICHTDLPKPKNFVQKAHDVGELLILTTLDASSFILRPILDAKKRVKSEFAATEAQSLIPSLLPHKKQLNETDYLSGSNDFELHEINPRNNDDQNQGVENGDDNNEGDENHDDEEEEGHANHGNQDQGHENHDDEDEGHENHGNEDEGNGNPDDDEVRNGNPDDEVNGDAIVDNIEEENAGGNGENDEITAENVWPRHKKYFLVTLVLTLVCVPAAACVQIFVPGEIRFHFDDFLWGGAIGSLNLFVWYSLRIVSTKLVSGPRVGLAGVIIVVVLFLLLAAALAVLQRWVLQKHDSLEKAKEDCETLIGEFVEHCKRAAEDKVKKIMTSTEVFKPIRYSFFLSTLQFISLALEGSGSLVDDFKTVMNKIRRRPPPNPNVPPLQVPPR